MAPHQSYSLEYDSKNVNISHKTDPLTGNNAIENVLNIHSSHTNGSIDSHGNYSSVVEFQNVLVVLENNENKDNLKSELEKTYESVDWGASGKSTINEGK